MRIDIGQLEFIDKKLRIIVEWLEESTGQDFTITSLFRLDDSGVHGVLPLRGIDFRMRSQQVGEAIVKHINSFWQYDPRRPSMQCAILHGKGSNLHIHVQSNVNTIKRN